MIHLTDEVETLTMHAVIKNKPELGFSYQKTTISTTLQPDEVLIKVHTASFCGTDYHIYTYDAWAQNRLKLPLIAGHEFSGEIIKIGSAVTNVAIGDIISAETHITCGECEFCLRSEGHICENTKIIGIDTHGCFANYVKIPAKNCFVNDKNQSPLHLSVQEPLGNAVHTMAHFDIMNKSVAILGCGPIGLMAIDVARALGAKQIIAIEIKPYRQALAKKLGADLVINPLETDVTTAVLEATNHRGVDMIGEFSGNKQAIEQAFKYLKAGGSISMLGLPAQSITIDLSKDVIAKGISLYGVTGRRIFDTWHQVKALIKENKLHLDTIITHTFPMSQINEAAQLMGSGMCGKIILYPEVEHE